MKFNWSTLPRFLHSVLGTIAIGALAFQWPIDHWAVQVFWTLLASYSFFCWTSCFHEAAHYTLCGSRTFSVIVGEVLGTVMFTPFLAYRASHIRHHAYLNKPADWELWPYSDPKTSLTFRRFFCWLEVPLGVLTSPYVYGRIYFSSNSPIRGNAMHKAIGREYLLMIVVWSGIITATSYWNAWPIFIRAWLIPHVLAGVYQTFRKFTEHLGMQSYDPLLGARTVIGPNWVTRLCCYFNFDIFVHGPHHRHPHKEHDQLCVFMAEYQLANPNTSFPVFTSYSKALLDVFHSMLMNPGVGMNVGASAPSTQSGAPVDDFVEDVTQELLANDEVVVLESQ